MKYHYFLLLSIFFFSYTSPAVFAGEVTTKNAINFGTIALHSGGDTITIHASNGPASPIAQNDSYVFGGQSGLISISSDVSTRVELQYPDSVELRSGSFHLNITRISENSQYSSSVLDLNGNGETIEASIGGSLALNGDEPQTSYFGIMSINVNFL